MNRDTTTSVIISLVAGILIALGSVHYIIGYELAATILLGFAFGLAFSVLHPFGVQQAQAGTSNSLKNRWEKFYVSLSFWACPVAALITWYFLTR